LQQANLPADLARLNDNAIIIIGGKPTAAREVKRAVLALDDKAIIIIGGRPVAAADMKRDLQSAATHAIAGAAPPAATPFQSGRAQTPFGVTPPAAASVSARTPSPQRVTTATPPIDQRGIRSVHWSDTPAERIDRGSRAVIEGFGFGATPGSVSVEFAFPSLPGVPSLPVTINVNIESWSDARIQFVVTNDTPRQFLVTTQNVGLNIYTSSGTRVPALTSRSTTMKRIQPDIFEVHRRVASAACRLALALLASLANHAALAQFPASALGTAAAGRRRRRCTARSPLHPRLAPTRRRHRRGRRAIRRR
jgi:hypothetical protein